MRNTLDYSTKKEAPVIYYMISSNTSDPSDLFAILLGIDMEISITTYKNTFT